MRQQKLETAATRESIERLHSSLLGRGKSLQTAKAYTTDLRMLLDQMGLVQISESDYPTVVMAWLTKYRTTISYKTTVRRMTSARAFARWAHWTDVEYELSEYDLPTPSKGNPHPIAEGMEGVRRMILVSERESYQTLIALCGMTGVRIGEALMIAPSHIRVSDMSMTVRGKGDKERRIPVSDECWGVISHSVMQAYCTGGDLPIVGLRDRFARSTITRIGKKAGIGRDVASHDLRATFATELYNRTKDLRLVQAILGHAKPEQTGLYVGTTMTTMHEGVSQL